jgi:mannose-6-phosphate isomerase-like protein (cupin superfamily)
MEVNNLRKLNDAVEGLLKQEAVRELVRKLKEENARSAEPFVWSVVDLRSVDRGLPERIKSCWVFVLKGGVPSGCHYHPNSVQHMVMTEGQGESNVGGVRKRMARFGSVDRAPDKAWYVIPEGVPHEFFPEGSDMVVVSFHTCAAEELEEVSCETGGSRLYEG